MKVATEEIKAAARVEAMAAWEENWRPPQKKKVAVALGLTPGCSTPRFVEATQEVFDEITEQQKSVLLAEAKKMKAEAIKTKAGKDWKLSLRALANRLGAKTDLTQTGRPGGRFGGICYDIQDIWDGVQIKQRGNQETLEMARRCARCDTMEREIPFQGVFCQDCYDEQQWIIRKDEINRLELQRMAQRLRQTA